MDIDKNKKTKGVAKIVKPRTTLKRKRSSEYDIQLEKHFKKKEYLIKYIPTNYIYFIIIYGFFPSRR
jgi:hypothetical protein